MNDKTKFLLKNLLKGFIWLAVILLLFFFVQNNIDATVYQKYKHYLDNETRVFTVYIFSELLFGIFPPELFMIWAMEKKDLVIYINIVSLLALISYLAGTVAFYFGRYLNSTLFYRYIRKRFLNKYEKLLNEYGVYLIIVAATTPIPYSAVCMMVGAVKYPPKRFFIYSLFRFVRFAAYSFIVWETIKLK